MYGFHIWDTGLTLCAFVWYDVCVCKLSPLIMYIFKWAIDPVWLVSMIFQYVASFVECLRWDFWCSPCHPVMFWCVRDDTVSVCVGLPSVWIVVVSCRQSFRCIVNPIVYRRVSFVYLDCLVIDALHRTELYIFVDCFDSVVCDPGHVSYHFPAVFVCIHNAGVALSVVLVVSAVVV